MLILHKRSGPHSFSDFLPSSEAQSFSVYVIKQINFLCAFTIIPSKLDLDFHLGENSSIVRDVAEWQYFFKIILARLNQIYIYPSATMYRMFEAFCLGQQNILHCKNLLLCPNMWKHPITLLGFTVW